MSRVARIKIAVLAVCGVMHVFVTLFVVVPGRLSVDEEVQHWMVRSFAQDGSLALWNGYEEFPSRELEYNFLIRPHKGKLYPAYPYLFAVLAGPLYRVLGLHGIYMVNAIAFAGTVLLCFCTARRLFRDLDLALNSCLILVLATFAWEYSQAIWPHATVTLFFAGSVYSAACALTAESARKAYVAAWVAGFVAGFGCGARIDGALVFPALLLPFLFMRPWRPVEAMMALVGAAPGLIVLAMTNLAKFGVLNPFSYGPAHLPVPKGIVLGVVAATGALWLVTRSRFTAVLQGRRVALYGAAGVVCLALLLIPQTSEFITRVLRYTYVSMVDFRALDTAAEFSAMTRTPGRGVVYDDSLKKAVLQSMPFLPLLLCPAVFMLRNGRDARGLWLLFLVPLTVAGYMAYEFPDREGGGLTLNYRYFVSALPCVAILCAYALHRLKTLWPIRLTLSMTVLTCAVTVGTYVALVVMYGSSAVDHEFPLLVMPLLLAAMLLALVAGSLAFKSFRIPTVQTAGRVVVTAAFVWAGLTAFLYDYPRHREIRKGDHEDGWMIVEHVPENSIFFASPTHTAFSMLLERKTVCLAAPRLDGFRDFPRLVEFHLRAGRRVLAFFHVMVWSKLAEGPLSRYEIRPVLPIGSGFLGEIAAGPAGDSSRR